MLMRQAMLGAMVVVGGLSADDRISQTEKGSVLITPFVQGGPDIDGQILLSNDHPSSVRVQGYVLLEDGRYYDTAFALTGNQPTSIDTNDLLAPFDVDSGLFSVYLWSVDAAGAPIRWNHLSGSLIQTDWSEDGSGSWEIPAFASQALVGDNGDRVGPENRLDLDGVTFAAPPASQVLNFFASGSDIISNSALCHLVAGHDFSDKNAPTPVVKIEAEIWNENEFKFSGTSRCSSFLEISELNSWSNSATNHFRRSNLGTESGKARLNGTMNATCEDSADAALLMVQLRYPSSGGVASGGVVGAGLEPCEIRYEQESAPEESAFSITPRSLRRTR